jgi:VCBS repeat-containing protein
MAMTQTKFLLDTCFTKKKDSENYTPIMIKMALTRGVLTPGSVGNPNATPPIPPTDTTIETVTTEFQLPLLTIIPLNSLAVQTVEIGFEMEVKSSFSEEATQVKAETSFEAKAGWGPFSVTVKGSASYDSSEKNTAKQHYEKSNTAKYTVRVTAGQLPLPRGVNVIIEAFAGAIQPITVPKAA